MIEDVATSLMKLRVTLRENASLARAAGDETEAADWDDRLRMVDEALASSPALRDAVEELHRAADLDPIISGLRRAIAQLEDCQRRAVQFAAGVADLSERVIASRMGVSQPTVHAWLDERRGSPIPAPSLGTRAWALHSCASSLTTLTARLEGEDLPERAPSSRFSTPTESARLARQSLEETTRRLAALGASLDYGDKTAE